MTMKDGRIDALLRRKSPDIVSIEALALSAVSSRRYIRGSTKVMASYSRNSKMIPDGRSALRTTWARARALYLI